MKVTANNLPMPEGTFYQVLTSPATENINEGIPNSLAH
jgi:hypothetical protein